MSLKILAAAAAAQLILATFGLSKANADEILTYTGGDFTDVSGPYSTSDSVSGTIVLATPLGDSFTGYVTPVSFSFSDGVQTDANTNEGRFYFVTSASGTIGTWQIYADANNYDNEIDTWTDGPRETYDYGYISASGEGSNTDTPGVWSISNPIPESGTIYLLGSGLLGLLILRRYRLGRGIHP
ncbi:MAG TPA: PEP-CTERM sorting domain-containing protein [Acetobacteraceae bacterium]|jgi:hypothetical protein